MSLGHVRQLLHKLLYCYKLWDLQQFKLGLKLKHKHGRLSLRCRHIHQMLYNAHLTVWDDFLDLVTDATHSSSRGSCTHYHVYITCTVTISSNDNMSLNYTLGLSDSDNNTITIVNIVVFTIVNTTYPINLLLIYYKITIWIV